MRILSVIGIALILIIAALCVFSCGKPVASTPHGGVYEIKVDSCSYILAPGGICHKANCKNH